MKKMLLVSNAGFLNGGHGGVQMCTREYADSIAAAGFNLVTCPIANKTSLTQRILYRLISNPYIFAGASKTREIVLQTIRRERPDVVFLNQVNLAPLARLIKAIAPGPPKVIMLSHGAEITDLVYNARVRAKLPLSGSFRPTRRIALGTILLSESTTREDCDAVVVISEPDASFEQWLGSRNVWFIPRIIRESPLDWNPEGRSLGYVGTLDHAPNLDGLVLVLDSLSRLGPQNVRVRVIGGPPQVGHWLTERFQFVDYLGELSDSGLRAEAAGWTAFLHPLFSLSRGCSTKLAVPIGWRIPIITTALGRRGYTWRMGELKQCDSPDSFAAACLDIFQGDHAGRNRDKVTLVAQSSPTLADSGAAIRALVDHIG